MPTNIHTSEEFNKQVVQGWMERPGFTGYQALDFSKLDDLEVYTSGMFYQATGLNSIKTAVESVDSKIFITGNPLIENGVQGTVVFQGDLSQQFDGVTIFSEQSTGINNYSIGTSNAKVLEYNPYRRELFIQNLATGTLYVKYGSAAASNSSFNFVLAGASQEDAGDGGALNDQGYIGDVNVFSSTPRYIAWERSSPKTTLI